MLKRTPLLLLAFAATACSDRLDETIATTEGALSQEINAVQTQQTTVTSIDVGSGFTSTLNSVVYSSARFQAALAREQSAEAGVRSAAAGWYPQASSTIRGGQLRESGASSDTMSGVYGNITVSQLLADGGATQAQVSLSAAQFLYSQAERQLAGNQVASSAADAWINLWLVQQKSGLLDAKMEEFDALFSQIERMSTSGLIDSVGLNAARSQMLAVQIERREISAAAQQASLEFKRYYHNEGTPRVPRIDLNAANETNPLQLDLEQSPGLIMAAASVIRSRAALQRDEAAFSPRASLQARADSPIDDNDPNALSVGLTVEYTLGAGGARRANVDRSTAALEAAVSALDDERSALELSASTLATRINAAENNLELLRDRRTTQVSSAQSIRSQLVSGQSNLEELISAEISAYEAELSVLEAEAELDRLRVQLLAQSGKLFSHMDD